MVNKNSIRNNIVCTCVVDSLPIVELKKIVSDFCTLV